MLNLKRGILTITYECQSMIYVTSTSDLSFYLFKKEWLVIKLEIYSLKRHCTENSKTTGKLLLIHPVLNFNSHNCSFFEIILN